MLYSVNRNVLIPVRQDKDLFCIRAVKYSYLSTVEHGYSEILGIRILTSLHLKQRMSWSGKNNYSFVFFQLKHGSCTNMHLLNSSISLCDAYKSSIPFQFVMIVSFLFNRTKNSTKLFSHCTYIKRYFTVVVFSSFKRLCYNTYEIDYRGRFIVNAL